MQHNPALAIVERKRQEIEQHILLDGSTGAITIRTSNLLAQKDMLNELKRDFQKAQAAALPASVREIENIGALIGWIVQALEFVPLTEEAKPVVDILIAEQNRLVHETMNETTLARVKAVRV